MGDRLATIDMRRKLGHVPLREELGPPVTQCGLGRGLPSYQVASSRLATTGTSRFFFWGGEELRLYQIGVELAASKTMLPGPRPTIVPRGILATTNILAKNWGTVPPFSERGIWVNIWHNVAWAEANLHTKWHLDPSNRLATLDMGRKLGGGASWV